MRRLTLLTTLTFICINCFAQQSPTNYWDKDQHYIEEQSRRTFAAIDDVLTTNPPSTGDCAQRRLAMLALDGIVHDTRMDNGAPLYEFMELRIGQALEQLREPVTEGIRVFKLYNDSFIIKTPTVSVAFDLFRGGPSAAPYIPDGMMEEIVELCGILLITHEHADHADRVVARMFSERGKTVIAPPGLWEGEFTGLLNLRGEDVYDHTQRLGDGIIDIRIFPGHQGKLINNIYHVTTPEGISVVHTGDQSGWEDLGWLAGVKDTTATDVLLVNCWTTSPEQLIGGIAPRLVIPGHENELNHSITHREANWLTWDRMNGINFPFVYMTWGERFDYIP